MRGKCASGWEACSRKYILRSASRPRDRRERKKEEVSVRRAGKRGSRRTHTASTRGHAFCARKQQHSRFLLSEEPGVMKNCVSPARGAHFKNAGFLSAVLILRSAEAKRTSSTRRRLREYKLLRIRTMTECCDVVCCRRALAEALCEAFRGGFANTPASFESIKGFPFRCVCSSV